MRIKALFLDYFKSVSFSLIFHHQRKKKLATRVITETDERKFIAHSSKRKKKENIILWYIVCRVDLANEITINHRPISLTLFHSRKSNKRASPLCDLLEIAQEEKFLFVFHHLLLTFECLNVFK
jgi:hypothetical protein